AIELFKLGLTYLSVVVGLVVMPHQGGVVQLGGVGDTNQPSRPDLDGQGMIVNFPVGLIDEAHLSNDIGGALRVGGRRPRLPFQLSTRGGFERVATALEELPFLLLTERSEIAGVVEAVIHEDPVSLEHGVGNVREMRS